MLSEGGPLMRSCSSAQWRHKVISGNQPREKRIFDIISIMKLSHSNFFTLLFKYSYFVIQDPNFSEDIAQSQVK